ISSFNGTIWNRIVLQGRNYSQFIFTFIVKVKYLPIIIIYNNVAIGDVTFTSQEHDLQADTSVVFAIRPEDIVPHGEGASSQAAESRTSENIFDASVEDMEFLGSFWRVSLNNSAFGDASLVADMSINAVRHMDVAIGKTITVEFPANRLFVFPADAGTF
ncbi:MAG: TOBE domain-containing protein, partial [Gammaproteobacteria bacterium]